MCIKKYFFIWKKVLFLYFNLTLTTLTYFLWMCVVDVHQKKFFYTQRSWCFKYVLLCIQPGVHVLSHLLKNLNN